VSDAPIIDVDTHLTDASEQLWQPYFTADLASHVPRIVEHEGVRRLLVGDLLLPNPSGPGVGSPLGIGAATHVASLDERVAYMERLGITHTLLLPGFVGLAVHQIKDSVARRSLAAAHNNLVHELCSGVAALEFVPVILPDDPEWSLAEVRRWQAKAPLVGVVSRPTTDTARPYRAGLANPVLRYLRDEGIALVLHGATGYHQSSPMADQFDDYRFTHVFSHPFEHMAALADLLGSAAMSEGLRVVSVEAGAGWVPWFLTRLQEHFDHTGGSARIEMDVYEVVRQRLLLGVTPDDHGIDAVLDAGLGGVLAFGSDFPHWDASKPEDIDVLVKKYPESVSRGILHANAAGFLGWAEQGGGSRDV